MTAIDQLLDPAPPRDDPSRGRRRAQGLRRVRPDLRRRTRGQRPLSERGTTAMWVVTAVGAAAVFFVVFTLALSPMAQRSDQSALYGQLREQLALATAPVGGAIEPGRPVALLESASPGLSRTVVVEGTRSGDLRAGPGHRRDTPLPGQPGVSVLYGRSVTFGAPFAGLPGLREGDVVTATTAQGAFPFTVTGLRRAGDPLPPPAQAGAARLTLVTAESAGWRTGWVPGATVFVDAELTGQAQPAPAGRPRGIAAQEKAFAADTSALFPLVLLLQALLAVAVAIAWARSRWGTWQTWLTGLPALLALAWLTTDTALVLLPNLF